MITHLDGASASLLPTIDAVLKTKISLPVADSVVFTWTVHDWNDINEPLYSSTFECAGLLFYITLENSPDAGLGIHLRPPIDMATDVLDTHFGFLMSHPQDPSKRVQLSGSSQLKMSNLELTV